MIRLAATRVVPSWWPRVPRRTARLRLTLLYGALFLLSGVSLLAITYLLFDRAISQQSGLALGYGEFHPAFSPQQEYLLAARAADKRDLLVASGTALAIVTALALLLGWYFAGQVLRPVRTITATARRISASNLDERLAIDYADEEFQQLCEALDNLFAHLEAAFDAQRHFVANASHELRTPLTLGQALLEAVLTDPDPDPGSWRDACERALAASRQQGRLIEALLTLARSEGELDRQERIDLSVICDDALSRPDLDIETLGLHVETAISSAPLDGDPRLIERLVANLVNNAIGHNLAGGHVQVCTEVTGDRRAVLSVANSGPIIPAGDVDRLFQPFERLDPTRTHHKDGHGLGLSIVRAIATAHGATITAQPVPRGGLRVEVSFPPPVDMGQPVRNGRGGSLAENVQ
jgi:signal transduction histidine kinase